MTSVLCWFCSIPQGLLHPTHNIQSVPPISKWTSRKNCTDCKTLVGESERPIQSTAWLQKQTSRHWSLSCSTVSRPTIEDDAADNIQTHTTRTWKFRGVWPRHGQSSREAEILHRYKKASGNLSTFPASDPVTMKFGDTWKRAEVTTPRWTARSYVVRDEHRLYKRNRNMLRATLSGSRRRLWFAKDSSISKWCRTCDKSVQRSDFVIIRWRQAYGRKKKCGENQILSGS